LKAVIGNARNNKIH